MADDEIAEIRRIRHKISARYDHDVEKVADYYRRIEQELRASGRYHFEEMSDKEVASAPASKSP